MKYLRRELTRKYNRQAVRKIKVSGEVVNERELGKLQGFTAIFIFIVASGAFLLALDNSSLSIADVISISVSAFVTAGPAIAESGSENSYGLLGNVALSMLMIVGRLSILPAAYMVLKLSRSAKLNLRGLRANGVSSDEIP
jgi:Trk-type K+ transport system membrane component